MRSFLKRKTRGKSTFVQLVSLVFGVILLCWMSFGLLSFSGFFTQTSLDSDVHIKRSDPRYSLTLNAVNHDFLKDVDKGTDKESDEESLAHESAKKQMSPIEHSTKKGDAHYKSYPIDELSDFLGEHDASTEITRRSALESILNRGNEQDIAFLFEYIASTKPTRISFDEWRAFVSNIVEYLTVEWSASSLLEERLLALYSQHEVSSVAQHAILKKMDRLYVRSAQPEKIEQVLWQAVDKQEPMATTALASLARLTAVTTSVSPTRLSHKAVSIVENESASPALRVVAMQIATWLDIAKADQVALGILRNKEQPIVVQLAAVAALLEQGGLLEIERIRRLSNSGELFIGEAAMNAIDLTVSNRESNIKNE